MKKIIIKLALLSVILITSINLKAQYPPVSEGNFVENINTGDIYWWFAGKLHHVQSWDTYIGLFDDAQDHVFYTTSIPSELVSDPLVPDNGLIRDVNTGMVYFRRSQYIHYIQSPAAFASYHFNSSAIIDVNGISGYTVRGPLPRNYVTYYQWSPFPTY
jgi:hypothetical protein